MNIHKRNNLFIFPAFLMIFLAFGLISCGSGGSGSGSGPTVSTSGTGSVAILLTDSPSDDFSEVNITITTIELLSDDSRVTVFSGNRKLNLLDLRNETTLFSIENNIPADTYHKIRLTVNDVELVDKNGQVITKEVKLPGNGKLDLNPRGPFYVVPGEMLVIQLDLDANKSLKIDENKNRYMFRPVVFIDVIKSVPPEKLLRVKGTVRDIDLINRKFKLCPDMHDTGSYKGFSNNDENCCITVYVSDDTSFFSAADNGGPVLFEDLGEGSSATVIGFYRSISSTDDGDMICAMAVDAVVVQIGEFIKLKGTIRSAVDPVTQQFDFQVDPDQPVGSAEPIIVQLQAGTKIYSGTGDVLDELAIVENRRAEIDGKLLLSPEPDVMNASFILLDMTSVLIDSLSGVIDNINDGLRTFDLITATGTECVEVTPDAEIYHIIGNVSSMITFPELDDLDNVDVYGSYNSVSGCFEAHTIIAFSN